VDALRQEGANVKGMLAIFTYGFETATSNFKEKELKLNTLSSYEYLIEQASETGYIKEDQLRTLKEWRVAPSKWLQQ
jgi:orotate phosphoribosyltransferase